MKNYKTFVIKNIAIYIVLFCLTSCSRLLDEKPDQAITTISSIKDLQALININTVFNTLGVSLADLGADEYVLSSSEFNNFNINYQKAYQWDNTQLDAWSKLYVIIYHANVVLDELSKVSDGTKSERDNLKGQALFYRSMAFYYVAQFYCRVYNSETANLELGVPLRLTPNVEEKIFRSTLYDSYEQIINDLREAESLLPLRNGTLNHPGKLAAWGFLSRVYLSMRDYVNAEKYASMYLNNSPALIDFNSLDTVKNPSIPISNVESVLWAKYTSSIPRSTTTINPELIGLYEKSDLRNQILFIKNSTTGLARFKGSYDGFEGQIAYCGIATNEIYLTRAECLTRLNKRSEGLRDLNTLLIHRYKTGTFIPISAHTTESALDIILTERRKELLFRSLRWTDLRRLNLEGANVTLKREINGQSFTLLPNDKRWVWRIPDIVVKLSGIQQNEY